MYRVSKYPHGTFSWAENISTDADLVAGFYQELFGWSGQDLPMGETSVTPCSSWALTRSPP